MTKEKDKNPNRVSEKREVRKNEKFFKNYKNTRRSYASNLEARVKALEETVAILVARQENKEEV